MGINSIGNPFNSPGVYGSVGVCASRNAEKSVDSNPHANMVVTEARARVSFAVATPQIADAMNLTPDERQEYLDGVNQKAASATVNLGKQSVMLDIYLVMEMIREMGQKLRNAMREMRQCENKAIQENLKSQAAMQREAAWFQMVGGAIVGALQAGASIYGTIKQVKGLNQQAEMNKRLGGDVASDQLDLARTGGNNQLATKQYTKLMGKAPKGVDVSHSLVADKATERVQGEATKAGNDIKNLQNEIGGLQDERNKLSDRINKGDLNENDLNDCIKQRDELDGKIASKETELHEASMAYNEKYGADPASQKEQTNKFEKTIESDKKELAAAQKELDDLKGGGDETQKFLDEKRNELAASQKADQETNGGKTSFKTELLEKTVKQYEGIQAKRNEAAQARVKECAAKLKNDYVNGSSVLVNDNYAQTKNGQIEIHNEMLKEVDNYKKDFDVALNDVNDEKRVNGKASAAKLQALEEAKYKYKLARAEQVKTSSSFDKLPVEKHQELVKELNGEVDMISRKAESDQKVRKSEKSAAYGMLIQGVSSALLGTVGQKIVEGVASIKQSKITEKQADEKMLEEQLDQIKDLFAQDLSLMQKALELFQGVISKESQSLEEIINALKA